MSTDEAQRRRAPGDGGLGRPSAAVVCDGVSVRYGDVVALHDVDLTVGTGEAVALLGPSGAGKTTLLHALAGFVAPSSGSIALDGAVVATPRRSLPPERRSVGVVFQHDALWPHLSVLDTVAYPLRRRGVPVGEARREAGALLERLAVADLAQRRPAELSGGQQQRVGFARALARAPGLYLFDEPTAHLDAWLRVRLADELAERRAETGAAALHATHDAAEALAVADRVVVLRDGHVVQQGTPREVYEEPVDRWAALLTGPVSELDLDVVGVEGNRLLVAVGGAACVVRWDGAAPVGDRVRALVRPEWTTLGGPLPGVVRAVRFRGPHTDSRLEVPGGEVDVRGAGPPAVAIGEATGWALERVWLP